MADSDAQDKTIIARFYTTDGEASGPQMAIPLDITVEQLHTLLNEHILKNVCYLMMIFCEIIIFESRGSNPIAMRMPNAIQ